jgi:pre-rRNA-processing protein TSR1
MFYSPDDINWFKPVELWTKNGLVGNIEEAIGTKGHMKCSMNQSVNQCDTICMSLYKRQFPPFDESAFS